MYRALYNGDEKYIYSDEELSLLVKEQQEKKGNGVEIEDVNEEMRTASKDSIEIQEFHESGEIGVQGRRFF